MLKTLKRYSIDESEKGVEGEDIKGVLLLSGAKKLNESGSSTETVSSWIL